MKKLIAFIVAMLGIVVITSAQDVTWSAEGGLGYNIGGNSYLFIPSANVGVGEPISPLSFMLNGKATYGGEKGLSAMADIFHTADQRQYGVAVGYGSPKFFGGVGFLQTQTLFNKKAAPALFVEKTSTGEGLGTVMGLRAFMDDTSMLPVRLNGHFGLSYGVTKNISVNAVGRMMGFGSYKDADDTNVDSVADAAAKVLWSTAVTIGVTYHLSGK
jgi:hypothetical protein